MRSAFIALACAFVSSAVAQELDEGVLVLTEANFETAIKEKGPLLVEFYAPWCGHCKKLAPEYAAAAKQLAGDKLFIAKVDATVEKDLATRFGIQGFPTLKFFHAGSISTPAEYNGGRDTASIVSWVRKKSGPATKVLASAADATAFLKDAEVAVIAFAAAGSETATAVETAAAAIDDISFGVTDSDAVRAAYGVAAGEAAVVSFNKFVGEENKVVFGGDATDAAAVQAWAQASSMPLVVPFTPESAPKIFRGAIKTHFLLFVDPAEAATEAIVSDFRAVARTGAGRCLFVTVDPSQDRVLSYFGVKKDDMPAASIVNMPDGEAMKKFMFSGDAFDSAAFNAFLDSYTAGKLKPFLKSEAEPTENDGPVTVLVGTTFEPLVLKGDKEIALVEFYAPWCGHCKALAPIWEELGTKFAGVAGVGIFKMDSTANEVDHPSVNIKGFPTIIAFLKNADGSRKTIEYDGARDLAGLSAFLNTHSSVKVEVDAAGDTDLEL